MHTLCLKMNSFEQSERFFGQFLPPRVSSTIPLLCFWSIENFQSLLPSPFQGINLFSNGLLWILHTWAQYLQLDWWRAICCVQCRNIFVNFTNEVWKLVPICIAGCCVNNNSVTLINWIHLLGQYGSYCIACCSFIRCAITFVENLLHLSVAVIDLDCLFGSLNNACRVLRSRYFVCFNVLYFIKLFWLWLPDPFPVHDYAFVCFTTEFFNIFLTIFFLKLHRVIPIYMF